MDPIEVREDQVASSANAVPASDAAPVERGFPVQATEPAAAAPAPAVPAAPVAPVVPAAAGTTAYSRRVSVYPVGYRFIQLIWLIVGVVDLILALDFIFKAAGANNTGFAHYIYRIGGKLAAPFNGIFTNSTTHGTVFRWADVLAVVIYTAAGWIVTKLVRILATPRSGVSAA